MSHNLKRLLIAVYICLVCLLAIATFLEQACGTDFVEKYIYHEDIGMYRRRRGHDPKAECQEK